MVEIEKYDKLEQKVKPDRFLSFEDGKQIDAMLPDRQVCFNSDMVWYVESIAFSWHRYF